MRCPLLVLLFAAHTLLPFTLGADTFGPGFSGYASTLIYGKGTAVPPKAPEVPLSYGGLTLNPANLNQLIVGGLTSGAGAAFYTLNLTRDVNGHIAGVTGAAAKYASASRLETGAVFGPAFAPGEVFFYTIGAGNGGVDVGMVRWGSAVTGKTLNLVADPAGSMGFVPPAWTVSLEPKLLTLSGKFYSFALEPDGAGTYDIGALQLRATLPVATVGAFVYVKGGSPGFPVNSMLVAETAAGVIAVYDVTLQGDPIPSSRRVFLSGPPFARPSGMFIDPSTNDLLVSTANNSSSAIIRIGGFRQPQPTLLSSCASLGPGAYYLDTDLTAAPGAGPCIRMVKTESVELDCKGHTIRGDAAVVADNAADVIVKNCTLLLNPEHQLPAGDGDVANLANSVRVVFTGNTLGSLTDRRAYQVKLYKTHNTDFVNNAIYAEFFQDYSVGNFIRYNRMSCPLWHSNDFRACVAVISIFSGGLTAFDSNTVDGRAGLFDEHRGAEAGIILTFVGLFMVTNNTFDRINFNAISTRGFIQNTQINRNRVTRTFSAGIEGSYFVSWLKNVVSENFVDGARQLIRIYRTGGIRPYGWDGNNDTPGDPFAFFQDNVISGNTFLPNTANFVSPNEPVIAIANKSYWLSFMPFLGGPGERPLSSNDIVFGNNIFRENDFGLNYPAPFFGTPVTPGIIIDGGGNICKPPGPGYPLECRTERPR